jgi:hypothetical protein
MDVKFKEKPYVEYLRFSAYNVIWFTDLSKAEAKVKELNNE